MHCLRMLSFPGISGNLKFCKVCSITLTSARHVNFSRIKDACHCLHAACYISYEFANSRLCSSTSSEEMVTLPDKLAPNVYNDVICCKVPLPNLNSANIFYAWFGAKPPNLKTTNISSYTVFYVLSTHGVLSAHPLFLPKVMWEDIYIYSIHLPSTVGLLLVLETTAGKCHIFHM